MDVPVKPFTIFVIGSFAPVPDGHRTRAIPVDTANEALSILRPALWIPAPKEICPDGGLEIAPEKTKDLNPQGMIESVKYLGELHDAREMIVKSVGLPPDNIAQALREKWPGLPLDFSFDTARTGTQPNRIDDILSMVAMEGKPRVNSGIVEGPKAWIADIDRLLASLLTVIFSDDTFRDFEAAWRGIEFITKQGPAGGSKDTHLSIVNTSRAELPRAFRELADDCETDPPDLVLVDFFFDNSPVSMELLEEAASFAQNLIVPTVINASAGFLGLQDWNEIDRLPLLAHHIEDNPVYAKWVRLCKDPRAHWLAAACNGFLVRGAYGKDPGGRGIVPEESSLPWIHPVFAVGTLAAQSVALSGWPSRLGDSQNVHLDGLALHTFENGNQASTEAVFTTDRLRQLGEIGLAPLAGVAMRDIAFMPSARTISGEPLAFQMFFSRMTGFLIRLRETYGSSLPSEDEASWLRQALEVFFRQSGRYVPGDLSVDVSTDNGRPVFEITLTPPVTILSGTRRITFTFAW